MKGRESGMPDEDYWNGLFDAAKVVDCLIPFADIGQGDVAEFGTSYGTFTLPVAGRVSGTVYGFEIEPDLVAFVQDKCKRLRVTNVHLDVRDFVLQGTGLLDESVAHVMIYNLLHIEDPIELLREAFRILAPGGSASVIHWRRDIPTPRGPSMDIRPGPEDCARWGRQAGFKQADTVDISEAAPYHYGMRLIKQ